MRDVNLQLAYLDPQAADEAQPAPGRLQLVDKPGAVTTRDGRRLTVDYDAVLRHFRADGLKLPIDINHATEIKAPKGDEAEPIGWIVDLIVEGARLLGVVRWLDKERARQAVRHYPYVSPAFLTDGQGLVSRLKSAALTASPALSGQTALAAAHASLQPAPVDPATMIAQAVASGRIRASDAGHYSALCAAPENVIRVQELFAATSPGLYSATVPSRAPLADEAGERMVAGMLGLTYDQFCAAKSA